MSEGQQCPAPADNWPPPLKKRNRKNSSRLFSTMPNNHKKNALSGNAVAEDTPAQCAKRAGLRLVEVGDLDIERRRRGRKFIYVKDGREIRDRTLIARLSRLAVPPAYVRARYCSDERGHIQAIWRDAVGRRQYRYHDDWEQVRQTQRRQRLATLARALPRVRRQLTRHLTHREPTQGFALAAVIELTAVSGIRAGRESYARANGTRGAATLLKSNVSVKRDQVTLCFPAKGGKTMRKTLDAPRLAGVIRRLHKLPGQRLFQYRDEAGEVRAVRARQVNEFLRSLAGASLSLKDFRTLNASAVALDALAGAQPGGSATRRKKQILEAMRLASAELGNTPAVCRKSYVPASLLAAFERGALHSNGRSRRKEALLCEVLAPESAQA
jgi:DNA topoisomerase-1